MSPSNRAAVEAGPMRSEHDYEAQSAADTISRAHRHLKNKPLMKRVKRHVKAQAQSVNGLAQLLGAGPPQASGGGVGSAFGQG
jgi:hypothetical protein